MMVRTRFAPSPTGPLHLGHAYSALVAHDYARAKGGVFRLRIDDLDQTRCRDYFETQIVDDLEWLGLRWDGPVLRQSERIADYEYVLLGLATRGLVFPCCCTRGDIRAALSAPQEGVLPTGPDGTIYPGTCRGRPQTDITLNDALRLDMRKAVACVQSHLTYTEHGDAVACQTDLHCNDLIDLVGDVVLGRRGQGGIAYHLACVVDDAADQVSHVIRGQDLQEATHIHVLLQHLLSYSTPQYHHHRLIRDDAGKRLAKRSDAQAIAKFREDGATPLDIRRMVGL